jgi:hypothetical protein
MGRTRTPSILAQLPDAGCRRHHRGVGRDLGRAFQVIPPAALSRVSTRRESRCAGRPSRELERTVLAPRRSRARLRWRNLHFCVESGSRAPPSHRYQVATVLGVGQQAPDHRRRIGPSGGRILVGPWKSREESAMSSEQVAPGRRGVTVKLLAAVDLGPEIEGMADRAAVAPVGPGAQDDSGRPAQFLIQQGPMVA